MKTQPDYDYSINEPKYTSSVVIKSPNWKNVESNFTPSDVIECIDLTRRSKLNNILCVSHKSSLLTKKFFRSINSELYYISPEEILSLAESKLKLNEYMSNYDVLVIEGEVNYLLSLVLTQLAATYPQKRYICDA